LTQRLPQSSRLPALVAEKQIRAAGRSFSEYVRQSWHVIEPATPFMSNWHIDAISDYLEAVTGGEILRLLINMPPRYMKSICVSVLWPTWEWINHPESRWLFAAYSASISGKHSVDRRRVIESDWYQARWSQVYQLTTDQNIKTEYENSRRGVMFTTSVGGTATGKGGTRIVVDDPHNPMEAESDVQRQTAIDFFDRTLSSRLDDKKKGAIVVVMQRLHEQDLSGHCIEQGYTHLSLPAEAEKRIIISTPSGRTFAREAGDILWPEREGTAELARAKVAMGSYAYAGQYQQQPSPAEGGMLKREWWRYYKEAPADFDEVIQSWDMTFKDTKGADYVVGQVWGRKGASKYLLDQVRGRMDFPTTIKAFQGLTSKWPAAEAKLVEDKANGSAVIQTLKGTISGIIAIEPQGGKASRVSAVSPTIEASNVYLPDPTLEPWVHDFVEECAVFPNGTNDDQVDSMSQALTRWLGTSAGVFF
jgi:predicted phage terminase large subunit-like protein